MTIYFDSSYHTFVDHAVNHPSEDFDKKYDRRRSHDKDDHGFFGSSWEDAQQFATFGDVERAMTIQSKVVDVANAVRMCLPRYDVEYVTDEGAFIDVARYVMGEPECIGRFVETGKTVAKKLTIAVNMAFNCDISSNDIKAYGARIAGIMLGLRSVGVHTELYLYYAIEGCGKKSQCIIDCTQCDVAHLAAAFSSYFFRRLWFSWSETQNIEYINTFGVGGGYGRSIDEPCEKKVDLDLNRATYWLQKSQDELIEIVDAKLKEVK